MADIYIQLQTGQIFEGTAFGAEGEALGEIVFSTAMTGYLEALSDPSYAGQILVQTFPLIGNYGVIPADVAHERGQVRAYVVREYCEFPSNYRAEGGIDAFLRERGIVGVCGVDTRALTEIIRSAGVMNARITRTRPTAPPDGELLGYAVRGAVAAASCTSPELYPAVGERRYRVALYDFGAKANMVRCLCERGCEVTVYPYDTPAETLLAASPDGIWLSNGPGDPKENAGVIAELRKLLEGFEAGGKPVFGMGLGHQLLALAAGADTVKLKYGHRGANQPVKDLRDGRVYVTVQNHGYAVDMSSLPAGAEAAFVNVNDGSCEGIVYPGLHALGVQFTPKSGGGPFDISGLLDHFIAMLEEEKKSHAV